MVRKTFKSIGQMIDKVAQEKSLAGKSRFKPRDPTIDRPGDVYAAACQEIAKAFPAFSYAKSGPHLSRGEGEFVYRIGFESSHNNVAGEFVALRISAAVRSPALKRWRAQQPAPMSNLDHVAGGSIGNLRPPTTYLEWNVATPSTRPEVLRDAVEAIHEFALPYFARFADVDALMEELIQVDISGFWIRDTLELLLCFRGKDAASEAATAFLNRRGDLVREYQTVLARFQAGGLPKHGPAGYAQMVAWAVVAYELSVAQGPPN